MTGADGHGLAQGQRCLVQSQSGCQCHKSSAFWSSVGKIAVARDTFGCVVARSRVGKLQLLRCYSYHGGDTDYCTHTVCAAKTLAMAERNVTRRWVISHQSVRIHINAGRRWFGENTHQRGNYTSELIS